MATPAGSLLYHPNSEGHHIFNLNLALIIVSTTLISLRLFVRKVIVKALGWDDLMAVVAWMLCVTLSALEMNTTHYGTGAQIEDVPRETLLQFLKRLSIMELVYFLASGAVRLAIIAFLPRLSTNKGYRWSIYALSAVVVIISVTGFFFVLTECSRIPDVFNYGAPWRKCKDKRDEQSMIFAYAIICILVDCMLVALPLWVVLSYVKMGVKSIQILLIFSLGIFAVVTGIVRFVIIVTTDFNVNTTYKMISCAAWTDAELHVGFWVGCFPALQPLLRYASFMLGLRNQLDTTMATNKRSTAISTDASKRRSVINRWSRGSVYNQNDSVGAKPTTGNVEEHVQVGGGQSKDVEMVDLEKGNDHGHVGEQTDVPIEVQAGETGRSTGEEEKEKEGYKSCS